uniref:G-protein coupled receptors family 1 profile domain-containing protein n=1 Tax=Acrobeloides nanus TaxID=290746 RepID=A0A914BUL7_9BILA
MIFMAIDRLLAVRKPLEYFHEKSRIRIYIALAIAITLGCIFCWYSLWSLENTPAPQCSSGASVTKVFAVIWAVFGAIVAVFVFELQGPVGII